MLDRDNLNMKIYMKKVHKILKILGEKYNKLERYSSWENFLSFIFTIFTIANIFGDFSISPDKDQVTIILTIVAISFAYSSLFISNVEKIVSEDKQKVVLKFSKVIIISPFFSLLSILAVNSKLDFQSFNTIVAWTMVVLNLISITIFSFCFSKLSMILLKSLFKKNK